MCELKLNVSTKIMKKLLSKLIVSVIRKKLGCNVDIELNALNIELSEDNKVHLHTDVDISMDQNELREILTKQILDEED